MSNYLDSMNFPEDIKKLNDNELLNLGEEMRKFLIESVSKTGGHLSSNLGVVELTLSLFKTFDIGRDKLIWDVGHQSYIHKILTGRKDGFKNLRKKDGLSGFPKRSESVYDCFQTGHSSTSISAALGMARARDIKKEKHNVIAVIGDGALTGGLAFEALNDIGFRKTKMIIVLNDNQMSIAKNVGGLSIYLNKLRMKPKYNKIKSNINTELSKSKGGKVVLSNMLKLKNGLKSLVVDSMLFEDMGIKYIGPIDGHNIKLMNEVFSMAKNIDGPVIVHTITKKGKGYEFAEKSPSKFHGISPFNLENGEVCKTCCETYSSAFGKALNKIAKEDKDVVAITAAMPDGTGLIEFSKNFPERFFDVGIAEEHAVTLSAGMASSGLKPVFAVYSTFLQRAYDEIIHDVCIQNLPVVFAIDRAGVVGEDGETHQGILDISYLSTMPNMTIVAPKSLKEVEILLRWALNKKTPVAIRYPKGGDKLNNLPILKEINYGKWEVLNKGENLAIIACGKTVEFAMEALYKLKEKNINPTIINATFIKPIDEEKIKYLAENNFNIITVEDNMKQGGLGSSILNSLNNYNYKKTIKILAYEDKFIEQASVDIIYKENFLDSDGIVKTALNLSYEKEK
ncbi:MAG: 1-deoxy-D-xylulose-5-phosphate synthase [Clostridium sp.]|nr:1-deoxy-D-xylulose-5-phosphate synthase [Clostridium sp.]